MRLSQEAMKLSWQFIRKNNLSKSEAMRIAWMNVTLFKEMKKRIVCFCFRKTDGNVRLAYGTLMEDVLSLPADKAGKASGSLFTYYDIQKRAYRSFRKVNLVRIES